MYNITRSHFRLRVILFFVFIVIVPTDSRHCRRIVLGGNERRIVGLDDCGGKLAFRVSPALQQHFYNRRQIRYSAVLIGTLRVHYLQNIGQTGKFARRLHSYALAVVIDI